MSESFMVVLPRRTAATRTVWVALLKSGCGAMRRLGCGDAARRRTGLAAAHEPECEQRRGEHQKQTHGVQYRRCPLAHASIHHDGEWRVGADQHQCRIEIFKRHEKRNRRRSDESGPQVRKSAVSYTHLTLPTI